MLFKILLLLIYFVIIFVGSRIVEFSASVVGVTSLTLICELIPRSFLLSSKLCRDEQKEDKAPEKNDDKDYPTQIMEHDEDLLNEQDTVENKYSKTKESSSAKEDVEFTSYDHFMEKVEDTKASVWVVLVNPDPSKHHLCGKESNKEPLYGKEWHILVRNLKKIGIKTGLYRCSTDPTICWKYQIKKASVLLSMPKGVEPKGKVAMFLYQKTENNREMGLGRESSVSNNYRSERYSQLLEWIKSKLRRKVTVVDQPGDIGKLKLNNKDISSQPQLHPSLNVVYESKQPTPPLILSTLSVRFTGRVQFIQVRIPLKQHKMERMTKLSLYPLTSTSNYTYGIKIGESFKYSNIEMFLRTLHPEVNDIFFITIVIINMACWLELFVQKGGPLKRIFCFISVMILSNSMLMFFWLPFLKLIQLPQVSPVIDFCLHSLQTFMFSDVASMVRRDIILISHHLEMLAAGFLLYGMFIAYLKLKFSNDSWISLSGWLNEDVSEMQQFFESLRTLATPPINYFALEEHLEYLLRRLAMPDLWLHPVYPTDYIKYLAIWKFCKQAKRADMPSNESCPDVNDNQQNTTLEDSIKPGCDCDISGKAIPKGLIFTTDCVICLDEYVCGDIVKVLPCGHFFHQCCIEAWLLCGTGAKNRRCPVCRWPANATLKSPVSPEETSD